MVNEVPHRRKPPHERAAEIFNAACEVALQSGLSAVTLRSVAARAGVTSALVAHYCGSMNNLIAETYRRIVAIQVEAARRAAGQYEQPVERLGMLCNMFLDEKNRVVIVSWLETVVMSYRNPALASVVEESLIQWRELFAEAIAEGSREGRFTVKDPASAAAQIVGLLGGVNQQVVAMHGSEGTMAEVFYSAADFLLGIEAGTLSKSGLGTTPDLAAP